MRPGQLLKTARYIGGHRLELTFRDGAVQHIDFGPWLNAPERTPYEKRYRNIAWFKRFRMLDNHAIVWGDFLIVFSSDKLRKRTAFAAPAHKAA